MFVFYLIALFKVQRILEERGESLFYPWRVPEPKKKARRIDGVLSTSIRRLKSGEDEEGDALTYLWMVDEVVISESARLLTKDLVPGEHEVTALVNDGSSSSTATVIVFVDDSGPNGPDGVSVLVVGLLVVVLLAIVVTLAVVWKSKRG